MDTKEKDQILESLFRDNPGAEVPQDVEIRVRRHLTALRERMEAAKGEERPSRVSGWSLALRYATPAVILIIFIAYLFIPGGDSSRAYADVVKQLRNARSLTCTIVNKVETFSRGTITVKQECIFKEPYYFRYTDTVGNYVVRNMGEQKSLTVLPEKKMYIETDYYDAPYEFNGASFMDGFRSMPERADEILGEQEMGGHTVRGFRVKAGVVTVKTLWVDTETGELIRMEEEHVTAPGSRIIFEDIRFDIEYDDSFFSLKPPSGFTPVKAAFDASISDEQDLINALDFFTSHQVDGLFPETLNYNRLNVYLEDLNNIESGELRGPDMEGRTEAEKVKIRMDISSMFSRGFSFVMNLDPQKCHYAGKGVKRGAANTPVFWYKPDGSKNYRVIYADLTVRDVAPKDLPSLLPLPAVGKN
jgi:outer membrane lipoprotein-sorting protein